MSQQTKYVNIQRSYVPMDPNSFPESLLIVDMKGEERIPVMAYDGANFLPTAYGYKSYFGTSTTHPADALAERIDAIIVFQNQALENILFALCDSGIWYKGGEDSGAWTQLVTLPNNRGTELHFPWTWATLDNELYFYRSNGAVVYKIESQVASPGFVQTSFTPTFLNMEGQLGIFRAGNRLGFWDSANSVAWSSLDDFTDFTPDLTTLAGSSIFSGVIGRIINIKPHGEGFIIYASRSIVYVAKSAESLFLWDPTRILENTGIAYMNEVSVGAPDTTHYAYTTTGIYRITDARPELIFPDVYDYFATLQGPKYVSLVEGRYLFFGIIDPNFTTAAPIFIDYPVPPITVTITAATFEEMFAQTQGLEPSLGMADFLNAMQLGYFIDKEGYL